MASLHLTDLTPFLHNSRSTRKPSRFVVPRASSSSSSSPSGASITKTRRQFVADTAVTVAVAVPLALAPFEKEAKADEAPLLSEWDRGESCR